MQSTSVVVRPLQPPFSGEVIFFKFAGRAQELAVSKEDAAAIFEMISGNPEGRQVVLEAAPDGFGIVVSVLH